jgi:hypothetical protein
MAEQWRDLYFRHNLADTGLYPTQGTQSASPDVIPLGAKPVSDPSYLIADSNWMKDYGNSTNASESNYIYLRGRNLSSRETEGELFLYSSPASLLPWPTDPADPSRGWANRPLRTSDGKPSVLVRPKAGERFVTTDPFRWIPEPISNGYYSLIGRVATAEHPNPIPDFRTMPEFAKYISEHPNMAWRNVVTINPSGPATTTTVSYSQGDLAWEMVFVLRCENVPDGSRVSFSSGTPGPSPLIEDSAVVRNRQTSKGPTFTLALVTYVPAGWHSDIAYTWHSEGKVPVPGMRIYLEALMAIPVGYQALASAGRPLTEFGVPQHAIRQDGPQTGILLGGGRMETLPVAVNSSFAR